MKGVLLRLFLVTSFFVPINSAKAFSSCGVIMNQNPSAYTWGVEREPFIKVIFAIANSHSGNTRFCGDKGTFDPVTTTLSNYSIHDCDDKVGRTKIFVEVETLPGQQPIYGKAWSYCPFEFSNF